VTLLRSFLRSSAGRVILIIGVLMLIFQIWTAIVAPTKIDRRVYEVAKSGYVDVVVTLNFQPESYHFLVLQEFGRVSGSLENAVILRRVPLKEVSKIARIYWVKKIEPYSPR
jgi:hypothetical protein